MSGRAENRRLAAVALRHDRDGELAPRIVAKGTGELAERILELARASEVPIHSDPDLVALLAASEIGAEIPTEIYEAVARVLAWLYGLARLPAPGAEGACSL
jgi:flagellar biosynthesis protein